MYSDSAPAGRINDSPGHEHWKEHHRPLECSRFGPMRGNRWGARARSVALREDLKTLKRWLGVWRPQHLKRQRLVRLLLLLSMQAQSVPSRPIPLPPAPKPSASQIPAVSTPSPGKVRAPDQADHEDLNSLSIAPSRLQAETPIAVEKDDYPEFKRELLRVQWRNADPIDLYVIKPKGVDRPPPVVLYLYSYPSETERFRDRGYCQRVTQDGFAAIGFVSALTGHRYHGRPMRKWFVSELQEALVSSVHDVQMVLSYLSSRGDLDLSRVGMFGAGSGATIAILTAVADPRIKALDLLDPWGDWPDWMAGSSLIPEVERPDYLKPEFLQRVSGLDPVRHLPQLSSRDIRLQHVMDDSATPPICKQRIESAAPPSVQIIHYDTTRALFSASSGGRLFQWIKKQLQSSPQAIGTRSPRLGNQRSSGNRQNHASSACGTVATYGIRCSLVRFV